MIKQDEKNLADMAQLFTGLAQAMRCCRQDAAFCSGVTFHQYIILNAVFQKGRLRMSDLHPILAVEKSTTTRLLTPLIAKGLLKKEPSRADSRAFDLTLTQEGKQTHFNVKTCLDDFLSKVEHHLPEKERDNILQSVQAFIDAIKSAGRNCNCCP